MSLNNNQQFGLDASQYFQTVDKIIAKQKELGKALIGEISQYKEFEKIVASLEKRFQKLIAAQEKSLKTSLDDFTKFNTQQDKERAKADAKAKKDAEKLAEQQRRLAKLNEQAQRQTRERMQKLLDAEIAKEKELERQRRRTALASSVTGTLQRQFITPSPSSPEEVQRVASSIAKINQLIESGAIKASRAMQIIRAVQAGTAQVFTGAANQVANLAVALQKGQANLGAGYIQQLNAANAATTNFAKSTRTAGKQVEESTRQMILSWQSVGRIFIAQSLHTIIGRFIAALREGVETAKQFEIRISEIRTISQDSNLSFEEWASSVRNLSDQFGAPILDVAEGTYEAISNQIAKGADAATFMNEALRFAQVTVSSTEDSVNLLSSVINAYNLNVSDTQRISAQLFKTIELGRVRASELANSFGRIAPVAANLGISLEELEAAIATITIQGIKPAETLTAIQGVMTELIRPGKEMKRLLDDIGVGSGEAAVKALTFQGVLRKVLESVQSGEFEEGVLFNEIRGTRGITALTRALDNFDETLIAIREGSLEQFIAAQNIATESSGKKFQIEMNKIKNLFVEDFGRGYIDFLIDLTSTTDSAGKQTSHLAERVEFLIDSLTLALETYIAYRGVMAATNLLLAAQVKLQYSSAVAARAQALGFTNVTTAAVRYRGVLRSLAATLPTVALLAVIGGIVEVIQNQFDLARSAAEQYENLNATAAEQIEQLTSVYNRELDKQSIAFERSIRERFQLYANFLVDAQKENNKFAEAQKETFKKVNDDLEVNFKLAGDKISQIVSDLDKFAEIAGRNIEKAFDEIFKIQENLTSGRFEAELKLLPDDQQVIRLFDEIKKNSAESANILLQPFENAEQAQKAFEKSQQIQKQTEQQINLLFERRREAETERARLIEQIGELQARISFRGELGATQEQLENIKNLQNQINTAHGETKTALELELATQKALLEGQADTLRDNESIRKDQVKLQSLQLRLEAEDQVIANLGDEAQQAAFLANLEQERLKVLEQFVKLNEGLKTQAEQQAEAEKKRLEQFRQVTEELEKFELPEIKTEEDAAGALAKFDAIFNQAIDERVITSEEAIQSLVRKRIQLEQQAAIEIGTLRNEANQKVLDETEQSLKDEFANLVTLRKNLVNEQGQVPIQLEGIAKSLLKFSLSENVLQSFSSRFWEVAYEESTRKFLQTVDQFTKNPIDINEQALRQAFNQIIADAIAASGESGKTVAQTLDEIKIGDTPLSAFIDKFETLVGGFAERQEQIAETANIGDITETATKSIDQAALNIRELTAKLSEFESPKLEL